MKEEISEALIDFYDKMLAREFSEIKKVQSDQGERFIDVLGHFDSVYKRFDRLEDEYHTITYGLKRIEDQLDGDMKNRKVIETKFWELKQQFEGMQLKLAAIEKEIARPQSPSSGR